MFGGASERSKSNSAARIKRFFLDFSRVAASIQAKSKAASGVRLTPRSERNTTALQPRVLRGATQRRINPRRRFVSQLWQPFVAETVAA